MNNIKKKLLENLVLILMIVMVASNLVGFTLMGLALTEDEHKERNILISLTAFGASMLCLVALAKMYQKRDRWGMGRWDVI